MEPADGGGANAPKVKAKPVQWTEAEIDALQRALKKHGNRWTVLKQDPEFATLLWRPIGSLQSKWAAINPSKRDTGLSPGGTKRKDPPSGKKGVKNPRQTKRVSPGELLARAFDTAPTLSELSVHSEAEEDEGASKEVADSLVEHLMEHDKQMNGLGSVEGGNEGGLHGERGAHPEPEAGQQDGGPTKTETANGLETPDVGHTSAEENAGANSGAAVPMEMDGAGAAEHDAGGMAQPGGNPTDEPRTDGGLAADQEPGPTPEGPQLAGGARHPDFGGLQGANDSANPKPEPRFDLNESHRPELGDLAGFDGVGGFGGAEAMADEGHFEDAPDDRQVAGRERLAEIQPGAGGLDESLGFFPAEALPEEEENAVLAKKRAEIAAVERKLRVLESRRDAWMRAFEAKRTQYCSRMADVEITCRKREAAQEEQRKVVYQEKWALEAARQTAAQLVQDLLALVPAPDNISLDKLHPSMAWESTFGPQCIMKREIIQKGFDKRQRAVGMLKAAALDARRKKLTMARKLGLDARDEELTEEALQASPEFRAFNEKLDELKQQMEADLTELEARENAARGAWVAFQGKGETVHEAEAKLKALLKEGQLKKSRGKQARQTM
ncbi:hypothetical protein KFL_006150040 [Klebsormidium nitens]|uniref:Myb-like domain-containing protein n=1 Tax=Klebsormidium nitens TaxID=105231 RepID=A0A1Y1IJC2_KLENI|nr:hypothetical protein KFL_006150040 [Klebsormidium nitens]|eukprot:GAQ90222.1 hypothetical protein KFL_006150040 [Klebsormidium nitens]